MAQFLAYTIKTTQVVEAEDPNEIRDIMDKLRECGSIDDYDVSVVEAEDMGAALDKFHGNKSGWSGGRIRHDGSDECPVHPMDVVELRQKPLGSTQHLANKPGNPASIYGWSPITHYRPLRDEDGVPYCAAEGLLDWANYVATDDADDLAYSYEFKPVARGNAWATGDAQERARPDRWAPVSFINTRDHWTQTLRRVYRREDA